MARYEPLGRFLQGRDTDEVSLSFAEVETLLKRALPPSARRHQAWWANTPSHSHALSWLRAGWRTERLDRAGERVVFVRDRATGMSEPPAVMEGYLVRPDQLSSATKRLVETEAARRGLAPADVAADLLNEAVAARRRALMNRLAADAPRVDGDSTDLIREDRDGR